MDVFIYYLFSHAVTINTRESPLAEVERRRPKEKKSVKDLDFISRILTLKLEKATKFCDVSTNYLTGST